MQLHKVLDEKSLHSVFFEQKRHIHIFVYAEIKVEFDYRRNGPF